MTKLEQRISAITDVAASLREYYVPNPSGSGFVLNYYSGAAPSQVAPPRDPMARDLPGGQVTQPSASDLASRRDALRETLVAKAVATISPRAEGREALAAHYRSLIEIRSDGDSDTGEAGSMTAAFLMTPGGFRRPTIIEGMTGGATFEEFLAYTEVPKSLLVVPPRTPTRQEAAMADSEPYAPPPKNVTLTKAQSHNVSTYMAAMAEATKRGGELIVLPEPEQPEPSFIPNGRDVPLSREDAANVEKWNAAWALAASRGGEVRLMRDRATAPKPRGADVLISTSDAADLRLFNEARAKAQAQGGSALIVDDAQGGS